MSHCVVGPFNREKWKAWDGERGHGRGWGDEKRRPLLRAIRTNTQTNWNPRGMEINLKKKKALDVYWKLCRTHLTSSECKSWLGFRYNLLLGGQMLFLLWIKTPNHFPPELKWERQLWLRKLLFACLFGEMLHAVILYAGAWIPVLWAPATAPFFSTLHHQTGLLDLTNAWCTKNWKQRMTIKSRRFYEYSAFLKLRKIDAKVWDCVKHT